MAKLPLTLACGPYDRTGGLRDGRVEIKGVDLRYLSLDPEEIFFRMARNGEFDASEMSLSTYVLSHVADGPFVALPIFPSRAFRHSGIYVSEASGLAGRSPSQLAGRIVGTAEYQLTANVWIRGFLEEHYGLSSSSVRYVVGGLNEPGRIEKVKVSLPSDVSVAPIRADQTLSEMLATGEIDAIYSPRAPACFDEGRARRLFLDSRSEERQFFQRTRVFPIMHVLVLHRRIYEANPWVARELVKAFEAAKSLAYAELARTVSLATTLPWVGEEFAHTVDVMGADYWSYGLTPDNRVVLETFLRYATGQGLVDRALTSEDLFAPESTESYVI